MKLRLLGMLATALVFASCNDDTTTIGIVDNADNITVTQGEFEVSSSSLKADSVLAKTGTCYFGRITDPETNSVISSDFLAQLHVQENYEFPAGILRDASGEIQIDSIELRLYFNQFYGDSLNAMKMSVYELDTANVLQENVAYYSNIDPQPFVNKLRTAPLVKKVFSVSDLTVKDSLRGSAYYAKHVRVMLPNEYGNFIVNKYFENPSFFKNSYNFIRHVAPGFYCKMEEGNGTMLYINNSSLFLHYRYAQGDSVYHGVANFASTGEVIQCTKISNSNLDKLLPPNETSCTYLKTPAGIFTEITLPVSNIYKNHETDSVNSARLILTRYNNAMQGAYSLSVPDTLLMVRKADMYTFFEKNDVTDNETSFLSILNRSYNTYTFNNIAALVAYCKNARNSGAAKQGISTAAWEAKNPDWNKVVIIPVAVATSGSGSSTITRVAHNLGLSSTRLVGGDDKLNVQVIYSKFNR